MSRYDRVTIPNPRIVGPGLNAPGVATPPPDLRESQGFDAMSGLLGVTGGIAAVLNNLAEQDLDAQRRAEYAAEKAQNEADRQAHNNDVYESGLGHKHAAQKLAQIQSDITLGKLTPPADMTPAQFAESIINEDTQGFSPAYRAGYEDIYDNLVHEATAYKAVQRKQDYATKSDLVQGTLATDGADIGPTVDKLASDFPEMSQTEILSHTVVPAAKVAAESGNFAQAQRLLDALPKDQFADERLDVQAIAQRTAARHESQTNDAFSNQMAAMRNAGYPPEAIQAAIKADKTVDENKKEAERIATEQYAEKRKAKITQAQKNLIYEQQRQQAVGSVRTMLSGGYTVSDLPDVPDAILPEGETKNIPKKEVVDQAVSDQMHQIAVLNAGNPIARTNAEFDFLANSGATYQPWKSEWQGVVGRLSSLPVDSAIMLDEPTKAAVERFAQLRAEGRGGIINAHMDEGTKRYLNDLVSARETRAGAVGGGDADWAEAISMVNAKTNAVLLGKRRLSPENKLVDDTAATMASSIGASDVRKLSDYLFMRAQYKLDTNDRISPDQAVEQARQELMQDFVAIDGLSAGVRGRINQAEVPAVEAVVPAIKSLWQETTGKGRNASGDLEYRLGFNETSGNFTMVGTQGGVPTGTYDAQFAVSSDDLLALGRWNAQRQVLRNTADDFERGTSTGKKVFRLLLATATDNLIKAPEFQAPDPAYAAKLRAQADKIPASWSPTIRAAAERIIAGKNIAPEGKPDAITQGMTSFHP